MLTFARCLPVRPCLLADCQHTHFPPSTTQAPSLLKYTDRRLVRVLFAWAPRIMRLFKLKAPREGIVLQVDGNSGTILRTLGDADGQKVWGVTSAIEAGGRLFLGSLHAKGIPVLDLNKVETE